MNFVTSWKKICEKNSFTMNKGYIKAYMALGKARTFSNAYTESREKKYQNGSFLC